MNELTRSILRLSWSMSMLGLQQAANLMTHQGWRRSASAMDTLSHAAVGQLGEAAGGFYKLGDQLQNGLLDTLARIGNGAWGESCAARNRCWEAIGGAASSHPEVSAREEKQR